MTNRPTEFGALVERACGGDHSAFARLVEAVRPGLLRQLRALLSARRRQDAEDVLHEALLTAHSSLESLKTRTRAGFESWVLTIAMNAVRRSARANREQARPRARTPLPAALCELRSSPVLDEMIETGSDVDGGDGSSREGKIDLLRSLDGAGPVHRSVIVMRDVLGLPWETIALVLDRPTIAAAKQCRVRALAALERNPSRAKRREPRPRSDHGSRRDGST